MSKPQEDEKAGFRERISDLAQSLSPTFDERLLVIAILLSLILGAATMHWRREYLLTHPVDLPKPPPPANKTHL